MAGADKRPTKGVFTTGTRLPVAGRYLIPGSRRWMVLAGLIACGAAALWLALAFWTGGRAPLSPGPLSSNHANFEANCAACHTSGVLSASAPADGCRTCHEKVGDTQGTYSFAAHYAYRSAHPGTKPDASREQPCSACHPEHRGRDASISGITAASDSTCASCHGFGSFNAGHPEFRFARERIPDDPHLQFSHRPHVQRVQEAQAFADPQRACLFCHEPDAQGAGFAPIRFAGHCDQCHLMGSDETPPLPIGDPANPQAPGVETLEAIQQRQGPGVRWAFFTNPEEFRRLGANVSKSPLYHEDPWVMENLRRIRRTLYPGVGVAELLKTSVDHGAAGTPDAELAREAIATLRDQVTALRGRPEPAVQDELRALETLLAAAEARVDKGEPLPEGLFAASAKLNPALSGAQTAALKQLALDLTTPCRQCHMVSDAAILRVQTDQRTLTSAEFNHRVHLLQRPFCVDCHGAIPGLGEKGKPGAERAADKLDTAAIQNLPTIAGCQDCHTPREASNRCATCHLFHPDKGRYADLTVYKAAPSGGVP